MKEWRRAGIDLVLSLLLTREEEQNLGLGDESKEVCSQKMGFLSYPISDLEVPEHRSTLISTLEKLDTALGTGSSVLVHCRQGIGRTGLIASCLLIKSGWDAKAAMDKVSEARGIPVPQTPEQRRWVERYAESMVSGLESKVRKASH